MDIQHNTIFHEDTNDLLPKIASESLDLIVTDPPYGTNRKNDGYDDSEEYVFSNMPFWIREFARILKEGAHIYLFIPTNHLDKWILETRKHFTFMNLLSFQVYANNRFQLKNNYGSNAQHVIFAHKGRGRDLNHVNWLKTSNVWLHDARNTNPQEYLHIYPNYFPNDIFANTKSNNVIKRFHPNEKNPNLVAKFIELSSDKNQLVGDFFMGSGTTAIACKMTNRNYIGNEKSDVYYNIIQDRLTQFEKDQHFFKQNTTLTGFVKKT